MENNSSKDIVVFAFASGSQILTNINESESYQFVERTINSMMSKFGVESPKVGISGTKEDVCCFIAGLIEYQLKYRLNIELVEGDVSEYDPEICSDL